MKQGQNVIILTMKETGRAYVFGSLSAIYGLFDAETLGKITYPSLRNAVSKYIKDNKVTEDTDYLQVIYDTNRSLFTLQRAPLLSLGQRDNKKTVTE